MNVQIAVFKIERDLQPFSLNRGKQGGVDVEIDRVAKLVTLARGCCFDACGEINGVVTSGRTFPKASEQTSQCFVTKKIETFFSDLETNVTRQRFRDFTRSGRSLLPFGALWLFFAER